MVVVLVVLPFQEVLSLKEVTEHQGRDGPSSKPDMGFVIYVIYIDYTLLMK